MDEQRLLFGVEKDVAQPVPADPQPLTGQVLPIGGVKQELFAAQRAGLTEVYLPQRNEPDLDDVPAEILADVTVHIVSDVREILSAALDPAHVPVG
ncbi:MAG: hypothetical protein QM619_00915 [Micropruina sp.]|uniref:S16 family serine protease n=1 Tax=Micropruina sp. TaxID=2737536 RepID=UPI0039E3B4FD